LLTLAENIDIERIGNLVIEEVNVSISGDKRPGIKAILVSGLR
jgi:hypothetical protein